MAGRLTIVATIFLPLTFATGFFGMNFGWLVNHIDSLEAFLVFGVGGMVMPLVDRRRPARPRGVLRTATLTRESIL